MKFALLTFKNIFLLSVSVVLVVLCSYYVWGQIKGQLLYECVAAVGSDIAEYSDIIQITENHINNEGWYVLTPDERSQVLSEIRFDSCGSSFSRPQDMIDNEYEIAIRNYNGTSAEITVWSKGFDNISGTDDDIVFGERIK